MEHFKSLSSGNHRQWHLELQTQYPEIRTYTGQGIDDPYATLKFDLTPHGFHAQILSPNGRVFIDPHNKGDIEHYISYYTKDFHKQNADYDCQLFADEYLSGETIYETDELLTPGGPQLRTYRLCVAATGEYTSYPWWNCCTWACRSCN